MKHSLLFLLLCIIGSVTANDSSDWTFLFDGTSIEQWQAIKHQESFTLENGILKANSKKGMDHLIYIGSRPDSLPQFKNFELVVICKGKINSNSGIFIHTNRDLNWWTLLKNGYEIQLNNTPKDKRKTGSLYDVLDIESCPVDDTQWFKMHITVNDKRITVKLDSSTVVDYTEPLHPKRSWKRKNRLLDTAGGTIAIQAHDPNSTWYFKEIRIRTLNE